MLIRDALIRGRFATSPMTAVTVLMSLVSQRFRIILKILPKLKNIGVQAKIK